MQSLHRLVNLYRSGGIREVARGARDFFRNNFPYYYAIQNARWPDRRTLVVGDVSVTLDTSTPMLVKRVATARTEKALLADFVPGIRDGDICWDVGANVGLYACLAAAAGAETVAFEPVPENVALIRRNAAINDLSIRVFETALGAESGTARIPSPVDDAAGANHAILQDGDDGVGRMLDVSVSRGDRFVESGELTPPTVLKIDVEGAEADVLDGLSTLLANDPPRLVYVEVHESRLPDFGSSADGVRERLREAGYDLTRLQSRSDVNYHLKARHSRGVDGDS